jgi:hypothetical protein
MERLGVGYYLRLAQRRSSRATGPEHLPPDATLRRIANRITAMGMLVAFGIGAITTVGSVWVEVEFEHLPWYTYYGLQGTVTLVLLVVEFAVLFWVAMRVVYYLARLTGLTHTENEPLLPQEENVPNLLARAALEIPDPVYRFLGIDPLRHVSRRRLFVIGLLYRGKIFLTNALAKFVLRRLMGKGTVRLSASWVAVPITGIWNAYVVWKVAQEARLRLFGYWLVHHIGRNVLTAERLEALSPTARIGALRVVACTMVLTQKHHPNMLMLVVRIADTLGIAEDGNYDDWDTLLLTLQTVPEPERYLLLDLLCISAALDGHLSRLERRQLAQAFGPHATAYYARCRRLVHQLQTGRLHAAIAECQLDYQPG